MSRVLRGKRRTANTVYNFRTFIISPPATQVVYQNFFTLIDRTNLDTCETEKGQVNIWWSDATFSMHGQEAI